MAEKEAKPSAKKKSKSMKVWKLYEVKGETLTRKNRTCPKCGTGVFLAAHKERMTCGTCGYTEFVTKKPEQHKK